MKTEIYEEKAVLVGVITQLQSEEKAKEYLDELAFWLKLPELLLKNCIFKNWSILIRKRMLDPVSCLKLKHSLMKMKLE